MPNNSTSSYPRDKSHRSLRTLLANGIWIYKQLFKLSPGIMILYFISDIGSSATPIATSYFFARLVDQVILLASGNPAAFDFTIGSPIFNSLILLFLATMLSQITRRLRRYTDYRLGHYEFRIKELQLYEKISSLDLQQFEDPDISTGILKAQDNIWKLKEFIKSSTEFINNLTTAIITFVVCFRLSPIFTLVTFAFSIPNGMFLVKFNKRFWDFYNSEIESFKQIGWLRGNLTRDSNIPEHSITGSNKFLSRLAKKISDRLYTEDVSIYRRYSIDTSLGNLIHFLGYSVIIVFLIGKVVTKAITIGQFTFYETQFTRLGDSLDSLIGNSFDLMDMSSYITFIRHIFETEHVIKSGSKRLKLKNPPEIEFRNVSFKYPNSKKYVLKNINVRIPPGKNLAIVGENGAGKTTFIKLLLRFYDPTGGEIFVNSTPLKKINLEDYYRLISALFQEFNGYGMLDAKTNISIGRPSERPSMKKIQAAAQKADAHKFIMELENRYNQRMNKQFTGGTNLSSGQWQKLALSRIFYRDTPILILDEPTAAIDAEAEYKIFQRIYKFIKNKTVIIISHRFSTVRAADHIIVLDNGRIVETGTHDNLLSQNSKYAHAFLLQAEGYSCKDYEKVKK